MSAAVHSFQTDEAYSYDANGNRTNTGYSTGTNNQLLSDGTFSYEYDDEGNRTRKTTIATGDYVEYSWDHRNRLTGVTFRDSTGAMTKMVAYTHDALNNRIARQVDDDGDGTFDRASQFVFENSNKPDPATGVPLDDIVLVFEDADGDGAQPFTLSSRLLHGPAIDQVFATESATGDILWSLADHQGTVRDWVEFGSGKLREFAGLFGLLPALFGALQTVCSRRNPLPAQHRSTCPSNPDGETGRNAPAFIPALGS